MTVILKSAPRWSIWLSNHYDGGYQAGKYLKELGHKKALCIADNFICMDKERIEGFRKAFETGENIKMGKYQRQKRKECAFMRINIESW